MPILMSGAVLPKQYTHIIMRNLLAESMTASTSSYYLNEDKTKSDTPYYDAVVVKIELSDKVHRFYQIHRNSFVGRTDLPNTHSHSISSTTFDNNLDYHSREKRGRFMTYADDQSFAKAINAIQKKIKG